VERQLSVTVRSAAPNDDVAGWVRRSWGDTCMAVHGRLYQVEELSAVVADAEGAIVGVLTYGIEGGELEIVSCDADPPGRGVGRALVTAVIALARTQSIARVRCTTTNDNLPALGFWQAVGFRLTVLRPNAVGSARRLKPSIPHRGYGGLPIGDELDLEFRLGAPLVLAELPLTGKTAVLREATAADVSAIVDLLRADQLGATRDGATSDGELKPYLRAFRAIESDPSHLLVVADDGTEVVATMQLSFLPGMARRGALRAQIEAVRVRADFRSLGLGTHMFSWAIAEARRRGCALVQLTTDKSRVDAHRFYDRLGFVASHEGLKLHL
jgi:GNAT superfamily N-acetyltransferase